MAHAMFADDFPRYNEELPASFVEYMDDKDYFRYKEPELYWLFENKLKQYENNISGNLKMVVR